MLIDVIVDRLVAAPRLLQFGARAIHVLLRLLGGPPHRGDGVLELLLRGLDPLVGRIGAHKRARIGVVALRHRQKPVRAKVMHLHLAKAIRALGRRGLGLRFCALLGLFRKARGLLGELARAPLLALDRAGDGRADEAGTGGRGGSGHI